ncbi:MAG: amino acid--tRNA ligase-related protein [Ignavibacteriaceae bacterium]
MEQLQYITTKTGNYSNKKFNALIDLRRDTLSIIREALVKEGFTEVLTAVLVNIAGSCENPYASFKLPYYGKDAHLSQSAQLQLEKIVVGLKRKVFTVNNSFREENFEDPENNGRRLSEFTLVEPEMPFDIDEPENNLLVLINLVEKIIKEVISHNLNNNEKMLLELGANLILLESCLKKEFKIISYSDAITILNNNNGGGYSIGYNFSIKEEKLLLKYFNNVPFFITNFPYYHKLFNIKNRPDNDFTYSFDFIAPRLGETVGGGLREEDYNLVYSQLMNSKVGKFLKENNENPKQVFEEYFSALEQQEKVPRGGFGIGFERLIGFLINSNDILNTITYRSFAPQLAK